MGAVSTVPKVPCCACESKQDCDGKPVGPGLLHESERDDKDKNGEAEAPNLVDASAEEPIDGGKIDTTGKMPVPVHYAHGSTERHSSSNTGKPDRHSSKHHDRGDRHSPKKEAKKELASLLRLRNFSSGLVSNMSENGEVSMMSSISSMTSTASNMEVPDSMSMAQSMSQKSSASRPKSQSSDRRKGRPSTTSSRTDHGSVAQPGSEDAAAVVVSATGKEVTASRRSASTNNMLAKFAEVEMNALPEANGSDNGRTPTADLDTAFRGQWNGTARHGVGRQHWTDGSFYEGEWCNNKAHGRGKFEMPEGDSYLGEWSMGVQHGVGSFRSKAYVYYGQWVVGLQDGHGVEISYQKRGSVQEFRYAGFFHKGLKQGAGVCRWADGGEYYGEWQAGVITGKGNHTNTRGQMYRGQWVSSCKHGKGIHSWPDGRSFGGEYDYDEAEGYGFYTWPDGRKDIGFWIERLFFNKNKYSMAEISNRIAQARIRKAKTMHQLADEQSDESEEYSDEDCENNEFSTRLTWAAPSGGHHLEAHLGGNASPEVAQVPQEYRHQFLQEYVDDQVQARRNQEHEEETYHEKLNKRLHSPPGARISTSPKDKAQNRDNANKSNARDRDALAASRGSSNSPGASRVSGSVERVRSVNSRSSR